MGFVHKNFIPDPSKNPGPTTTRIDRGQTLLWFPRPVSHLPVCRVFTLVKLSTFSGIYSTSQSESKTQSLVSGSNGYTDRSLIRRQHHINVNLDRNIENQEILKTIWIPKTIKNTETTLSVWNGVEVKMIKVVLVFRCRNFCNWNQNFSCRYLDCYIWYTFFTEFYNLT